jgi:hypothetical protein
MPKTEIATCELDNLRFAYPSSWIRQPEESEDGVVVTLESPSAAFAIVGVYPEVQVPDDLIEQAHDTLMDEHPTLEIDDYDDEDWTPEISTAEASFLSVDTLVTCRLRSWRQADRTVFVMMQYPDREATLAGGVHQAICRSMTTA